jgi:hypothetical protein
LTVHHLHPGRQLVCLKCHVTINYEEHLNKARPEVLKHLEKAKARAAWINQMRLLHPKTKERRQPGR